MGNFEYERFEKMVERFINPINHVIEDGFKDSFIENFDDINNEIKRAFFFRFPKKLDEVFLKLDTVNRIKIGKLMSGLSNQDIIYNFKSLGGSSSGGMLGKILNYGNSESNNNPTHIPTKLRIAIITEIPAQYIISDNIIARSNDLFEYTALDVPIFDVSQLSNVVKKSIDNAKVKFELNNKRRKVIDVMIINESNSRVHLIIHHYKGFFELRFIFDVVPKNTQKIINSITGLRLDSYYYAPMILQNDKIKICIIGTHKEQITSNLKQYKKEIESLTPIYSIQ
ncbi:hypothetical protein J2T12_003536 [Paenibacillus anaericanus]|uniref:hypothetical protein n=1 Tax=Paenibacillus anaericanus TaxID=170367 RepID=UPI002787316C|nr:hypothetical protein [Paenibacillus anaericanus]MDQ0090122.1 hypothetical protein [Paenibacillus anaericanus]